MGPALGDFNALDALQEEHLLLHDENISVNLGEVTPTVPNHATHQRFFLKQPTDVIRRTFSSTTQYYAQVSVTPVVRIT